MKHPSSARSFTAGPDAGRLPTWVLMGWIALGSTACMGPAASGQAELQPRVERLIARSGGEVAVVVLPLEGEPRLLINPRMPFHAASTMKIPVMIELFRQDDTGGLTVSDTLVVHNRFQSIQDGSLYSLELTDTAGVDSPGALGQHWSLLDLCEAMIKQSSNLATNLLIQRLGVEAIRRGVEEMGAPGMSVLRGVEDGKAFRAGRNNTTTALALARLLFKIGRGEAVNPTASRRMIDILAAQHFNTAIPAGLPAGTRVAHKTGRITGIHHDAALVLVEEPYVLVILTRGIQEYDHSSALMARIAELVHRHHLGH